MRTCFEMNCPMKGTAPPDRCPRCDVPTHTSGGTGTLDTSLSPEVAEFYDLAKRADELGYKLVPKTPI